MPIGHGLVTFTIPFTQQTQIHVLSHIHGKKNRNLISKLNIAQET